MAGAFALLTRAVATALMVTAHKRWWSCFALGGALLGLATTAERVLHHGAAYGRPSAALLHACVAGLAVGGVGALTGATLAALDALVGATTKGRTRAICAVGCAFGAGAYLSVIRVSKYGHAVPLAVGVAAFAAIAAALGYAAARVAPYALRYRRILAISAAAGTAGVVWIDLHAYARSYGNVHLLLAAVSLLGSGSAAALLVNRSARIVRPLAMAAALALAGAVFLPRTHDAKNAILQLGGLEKLLIQHALWPALDRDGDGAASVPLGSDCDDGDPSNAPLRAPLRAPSLRCEPVASRPMPPRPEPAALKPKHDLVFIIVDTWRTDTPRTLPQWTSELARFTGYRSCGSRTEQVVTQLLGDAGCPKGLPHSSLARFLAGEGYELVHIGEYPSLVSGFSDTGLAKTRGELLARAKAFFHERPPGKSLFAVVHFLGGHANYDGEGDTARARYDDAIARTLAAVGEIVTLLPKDAVVVVAGDHGEEFGEHGGGHHGLSLYEEVLRTRVLVRAPGLPAIEDPRPLECVGLIELIAALVSDAPVPPPLERESYSVLSAPKGVHGGLSETLMFATKRADARKIIWQPRLDLFELYDLRRDPQEKHNLADTEPALLREMASQLAGDVEQCTDLQRLAADALPHSATSAAP